MTRLPAFAVVLAGLLMFSVSASQAAPGSLDPTFGVAGKVTTKIGSDSGARAVAVQPDGKIVAAGFAWDAGGFALVRYKPDGSLDQTFGEGGIVTTRFGSGGSFAFAVVVQPDGKIIAGGQSWGTSPNWSYFALARYNADGSLDSSFGTNGRVTTAIGQWSWASSLALQPDGEIVAAGSAIDGFAVARYNTDGSLDPSFGTDGIVTTAIGGAHSVSLTPEGKIIVTGTGYEPGYAFALARYNADGTLDTTFGSDGTVRTRLGDCYVSGDAATLQPDERIVVAGTISTCSRWGVALARYNPDGSLDPSFGSGGKVFSPLGSESFGYAIALQPDGKLVVAGSAQDGALWGFALMRYESDGSPDHMFGTNGEVLTQLGSRDVLRSGRAYGIALQPDGEIVAAGVADPRFASSQSFALVRYLVARGCVVPDVAGAWLPEAKDAIAPSGCSLAPIKRAYSRKVEKGFVVSQRPAPDTALSEGAPVHLVVSKGTRRKR